MPESPATFWPRDKKKYADDFTWAYMQALFWLSSDDDDNQMDDLGFHPDDLHAEDLKLIKRECAAFQANCAELLARAYERGYTSAQAGHDFYLERTGSGSGFWDRDILDDSNLGKTLADKVRYSEAHLYIGDDDKIYYYTDHNGG